VTGQLGEDGATAPGGENEPKPSSTGEPVAVFALAKKGGAAIPSGSGAADEAKPCVAGEECSAAAYAGKISLPAAGDSKEARALPESELRR
jgi:hypothetical protein